jgi:hypothetical protein
MWRELNTLTALTPTEVSIASIAIQARRLTMNTRREHGLKWTHTPLGLRGLMPYLPVIGRIGTERVVI